MNCYRAGIDIGSTTVKLVVLDQKNTLLFGEYRRHKAHTKAALCQLLEEARRVLPAGAWRVSLTGSGALGMSKALGLNFVQEVVAVARALGETCPQTDVAIELGGEDAKIIYFRGGLEERMNGVCAGGTGAFIDQMAALLQTDAEGLNKEAETYQQIYPIAARCGVFAKTDIQPLINEGATKADLAASVFRAVVNQTISGLACGKPIRGNVAFLGGPLHFLPELKKAFIRTLNLTPETTVDPENSHLFAALGAALESENQPPVLPEEVLEKLSGDLKISFEMPRLEPLFEERKQYEIFCERHNQHNVKKSELASYSGPCFLGIDAGSTTTKAVLIGADGQLLYSFYSSNRGNPIETAKKAMVELEASLPASATIARACSTGYGEGLLKAAFALDDGEVETVAHCTAASFFDPEADCVLDIGGQDMKCIRLKDGVVDSVLLNEACSSGCGSFLENFASSLGYSAQEFGEMALFSSTPVDLGTRCTVFMNSNVKQAQKEGASVSDISAGLAYSVVKNALYKVIKLTSAAELGRHIVVQGGTFHNKAVLRALEKIADVEVVCPDISGLMGAFGAALIARKNYTGTPSSMLPLPAISALTYTSKTTRCGRCSNRCMLTVNTFSGGRKYITGNRCEKGLGGEENKQQKPNMVEYKRQRLFAYQPLPQEEARAVIGLPRVLNFYENYPFWATFFRTLGIRAVLSPFSSREIYQLGMESIPSESECYPAKLAHGQVEWLIKQGIDTIFHPCIFYERQENPKAQNHFNCPMVVAYPENLKNNLEAVSEGKVRYLRPFMAFTDQKTVSDRLVKFCKNEWNISAKEVESAVALAWAEQRQAKDDIRAEGLRCLKEMEESEGRGIVLAGRPYHIDPEINHGIPELIASYGLTVFTEDSLPLCSDDGRVLRVVDQWVYHSRLYMAAEFVAKRPDLELIQLTSFGCGLDAVTADQVREILENSGKLYTLLKIDEVANLGAVRIRIRSLLAAMNLRAAGGILPSPKPMIYRRTVFSKEMFDEEYTILAPQLSPIHFALLEPVFRKYGYHLEILQNTNRSAIDAGLKYVNNDACYPSVTVVGQFMEAVLSERYDTGKLAILMTQTGGCCRASNYVAFIRRALDKAGFSHIPVISLNPNGMETNPGFRLSVGLLKRAMQSFLYGDILMRCLYRMRPYEVEKGSADRLHLVWQQKAIDTLINPRPEYSHKALCRAMVEAFDALPVDESRPKPRVGIVGEILVKYMPLANNNLVALLEKEGAEVVVPDFLDFFYVGAFGSQYRVKYMGEKKSAVVVSKGTIALLDALRKPASEALAQSRHFSPPISIYRVGEMAKPFLSLGNQYGEGWFLAGEMVELIRSGTPNIVCIQPFGCLPNHVVGKGVIKALKKAYPESNIAAVDYDPGASEVNQLNRIKLMLSAASRKNR